MAAADFASFGSQMTLSFNARFVDCSDAIDGEILQVSFDTLPTNTDEEDRRSPYLLIGQNFEFPGPATVEWHDGTDYDGGGKITSIRLERDRLLMKHGKTMLFDVTFQLSDAAFGQLHNFLRRMIDDRYWGK
jgi:hypothetical protein